MINLPIYKCHKKVAAAKIITVDKDHAPVGGAVIVLDVKVPAGDIKPTYAVDSDWIQRNPKVAVGGYFVGYDDNYTAYSPAEPFEAGYTLLDDGTPMTRQERIDKLVNDMNKLVDECRGENLLTYAEVVGVIELVKWDILKETAA